MLKTRKTEKWGLEKSSPTRGNVNHSMKWVLEDKLVYLMGFAWNYTENCQTDARFTRLKILIATFEDTSNISYKIKFKTYLFENKASDIIIVRENGERYVLDKDFNQIHETAHKRNVEKKIAERKTVPINKWQSSVGFEE